MTLAVEVISYLYKAGVTEDGEDYVAESYSVRVQSPSGRRWVHEEYFEGCAPGRDPDGFPFFSDVREAAKAKAEKLAKAVRARLEAGGKLDQNRWHEADPMYGSTAYQELDAELYFVDGGVVGYFAYMERHREMAA